MTEGPKELTVEQVAAELQVHKKRVYQWIQQKELPALDLGNSRKHTYRVSRADLDAFKAQRRTTRSQDA
jgi:excisionase family DNA binding protein